MNRAYDYKRQFVHKRNPGRIIDLGNAGRFQEVVPVIDGAPDELVIDGVLFTAVHTIGAPRRSHVFTAFRSAQFPEILVIVWNGFPFYPHIEEGGDFMLQTLHDDRRVRHLIIDNTYVLSGWLSAKMEHYLNQGWHPGLIELELKSFCHLQAASFLGSLSFHEFKALLTNSLREISERIGRPPFLYFPIETSEASEEGAVDENMRISAFAKSMRIIRSVELPGEQDFPAV